MLRLPHRIVAQWCLEVLNICVLLVLALLASLMSAQASPCWLTRQCYPQNQALTVAWLSGWGAIEHVHLRLLLTKTANFWFSAELTWMGIKCNRSALLDLQIVLNRIVQL